MELTEGRPVGVDTNIVPLKPAPVALGTALQVILGLLAILGMWGIVLLLGGLMLIGVASGSTTSMDLLAISLMMAAIFTGGLLLIPSVYYGLMRWLNRPAAGGLAALRRLQPGCWIVFFPIALGIGLVISRFESIAWLLLPPVHVITVGLPIAWMLFLAVYQLPIGTPQRFWGVFGSGLVLGPLVITFAEMAAVLAGLVVAGVYLSTRPDLVQELMGIVQWFQASPPTQEEVLDILSPYLTSPAVVFSVTAFGAMIVPLIEEALKPMGVWLLAGRKMAPEAGFAAGALSGAGYAFMESLLLTSNGQDWASLMVARIGTSAIHILNTALVGWALVTAWQAGPDQGRRYLRLAAVYLGAVALHGLWNGLTIYTVINSLSQVATNGGEMPVPGGAALLAPLALIGLGILAFLVIVSVNRRLSAEWKARPQSGKPAGGQAEVFTVPVPVEETPLTEQGESRLARLEPNE